VLSTLNIATRYFLLRLNKLLEKKLINEAKVYQKNKSIKQFYKKNYLINVKPRLTNLVSFSPCNNPCENLAKSST